jgi:DNA-directed RNA polymerase specialized sigma24 family protein
VTDIIAATKRNRTRANLIAAYEAYERREPGSMDRLMQLVTKFVHTKISHMEYEPAFKGFGTAETADDWAQEVTIKVWQKLTGTGRKQFQGDGAGFYAYVHKIAYNQASAAFNDLLEEKRTEVPLFTRVEDEDGEYAEVENPLIHADGAGYDRHTLIPASVQGVDLTIAKLLLTEVRGADGKYRARNFGEIGQILQMTEDAVKKRMERLRDRLKAEKHAERNQQQRIREDAENERRNSLPRGLAKIRGSKP